MILRELDLGKTKFEKGEWSQRTFSKPEADLLASISGFLGLEEAENRFTV